MLANMRSLITLALCAAAAAVTHATVIVPADFAQVVNGSSLIAHGRVVDVRSAWGEGRRRIDRFVTVDVMEWYRGGTGTTVTFTTPGGTIGRYRQVVVGAPVFRPGDEAFLFLKQNAGGPPVVFGLNQGIFRVRADEAGRRAVMRPALVLAPGETARAVVRGDAARRPVAIGAFVTRLRAALAAPDVRR